MWNESFKFDIHVPEQVMVRFVVEDYDTTSQNDLIGQYCLPLTSVQNGKIAQTKQRESLKCRKKLEAQMLARLCCLKKKTDNCLFF